MLLIDPSRSNTTVTSRRQLLRVPVWTDEFPEASRFVTSTVAPVASGWSIFAG